MNASTNGFGPLAPALTGSIGSMDTLQPRENKGLSAHLVVTIVVTLVVGIIIGRVSGPPTTSPKSLSEALQRVLGGRNTSSYGTFEKSWNLIGSKFVNRPIDDATLVQGAIEGMVGSLKDPYSFYLSSSESAEFQNEINGKFEGIGAELGQKDGKIVIIAPLPDTPADRAGLRPNDWIAQIDKEATSTMTLDQAVARIRGKGGTTVTLTIVREKDEAHDYALVREKIQLKSVIATEKKVDGGTYYVIAISNFTQTTSKEFSEVVQQLLLKQPKGIVIDVRNNSGGYLDAAVDVADTFLQDGAIVIEDFGNGNTNTIEAQPGAPLAGYPVAVLQNGGTASAAEILAGTLEDRLRAVTVGEKSFGKGSVQELETMDDGSLLKLTIAHWLTPNGRSIDGKGIEPSVPVPFDEKSRNTDADPQLDRALEILSGASS